MKACKFDLKLLFQHKKKKRKAVKKDVPVDQPLTTDDDSADETSTPVLEAKVKVEGGVGL